MYKRAKQSWMKHIDFILMDFIIIQLSFVLAYLTRSLAVFGIHGHKYLVYRDRGGIYMAVFIALVYVFIVFFTNSYSGILRRGYYAEFRSIVIDNALMLGGIFAYLVATQGESKQSRAVIGLFIIYNIFLMFLARTLRKRWIRSTGYNELNMHHILVVTTRDELDSVLANFEKISYNYHVVGITLMEEENVAEENLKSWATIDNEKLGKIPVVAYDADTAYEFAVRNIVDEVFIYVPYANNKKTGKMANVFLQMGITVHINLDMISSGMPNVAIDKMGDTMVMTSSVNVMSPIGAFCKRTVDIAAGIVGCLITGILFIFLAPAIKIADPGPVFFGQERAGKNGRTFKIYKFRSMYVDAEERKKDLMKDNKMEGLMFKIDADPRIIGSGPDGTRKGLGHWIRTLSLDEFPNFYSILKGDMSLVGTRPPTMDEYKRYSLHHKSRLAVKPGLTGMWQVSGRSDITDFEEIVELDNEYIRNWSFGMDIKIIFKTFIVVLKRKGSI